jgi:hypothetical protein
VSIKSSAAHELLATTRLWTRLNRRFLRSYNTAESGQSPSSFDMLIESLLDGLNIDRPATLSHIPMLLRGMFCKRSLAAI